MRNDQRNHPLAFTHAHMGTWTRGEITPAHAHRCVYYHPIFEQQSILTVFTLDEMQDSGPAPNTAGLEEAQELGPLLAPNTPVNVKNFKALL